MTLRSVIVALSLLASAVGPPALAQSPAIALALDCSRSGARVDLRMTVRNDNATDSAVVIGTSLGNGRRYLADSFTLDVKRGQGTSETYMYFDPSAPIVAGRLDPWILQVPSASAFVLTRPIGHFWASGAPLTLGADAIDVRLRLSARADKRALEMNGSALARENIFVGELSSEWRRVPDSCTAGVAQNAQASGNDAPVFSAVIAHHSDSKTNPLLVVAAETMEASRIILNSLERDGHPYVSSSLVRELRERNAKAQPIGDVRLPANAVLVPDALSLIRRVTPTGAELSDWSPFTHAYPGYQLLQLAAPAYFTPGQRALVYLSTAMEGQTQGWAYILEKQGTEWRVTWSESLWRAAAFA